MFYKHYHIILESQKLFKKKYIQVTYFRHIKPIYLKRAQHKNTLTMASQSHANYLFIWRLDGPEKYKTFKNCRRHIITPLEAPIMAE